MPEKEKTTALLLAGHGSTENPNSSRSTWRNMERIRKFGLFDEVACAFWLEEPGFADCLKTLRSDQIYIVPNFTAEGYYTKEILPREFGLTGRVTRRGGQTIYYCDPIGLHASMTGAILYRAQEVTGNEAPPRNQTTLFVAGHGTPRHRHSRKVVLDQVERLRAQDVFGHCEAAFMEEEPKIADWVRHSPFPHAIMVPYFMSDGLHVTEDIPELLGIQREDGTWPVPGHRDGKTIWYSKAAGTSAALTDVIVELVRTFRPDQPFCSHCPAGHYGVRSNGALPSSEQG